MNIDKNCDVTGKQWQVGRDQTTGVCRGGREKVRKKAGKEERREKEERNDKSK